MIIIYNIYYIIYMSAWSFSDLQRARHRTTVHKCRLPDFFCMFRFACFTLLAIPLHVSLDLHEFHSACIIFAFS